MRWPWQKKLTLEQKAIKALLQAVLIFSSMMHKRLHATNMLVHIDENLFEFDLKIEYPDKKLIEEATRLCEFLQKQQEKTNASTNA